MMFQDNEQPEIKRINAYQDERFSEAVLKQHGAFVVNDTFLYEIRITNSSTAVISGENENYFEAVIEEFHFFSEHISRFFDKAGNLIKEYPPVELFSVSLKAIQPSQFYVDKSKKDAVSSFLHTQKDVIIPLKKYGNRYISLDGHTRMSVACDMGFEEVYGFLSDENADYLSDFVTEAERRNIFSPYNLVELEHEEYERRWNHYCEEYFS